MGLLGLGARVLGNKTLHTSIVSIWHPNKNKKQKTPRGWNRPSNDLLEKQA
jgi:hypothetical protein